MTIDTELETWKQEWRDQTEPLPRLKKKIKRQNLRMAAAGIVMLVCLTFSTVGAVLGRSSFVGGFATGLWSVALIAGGYIWWVRRGAWKASSNTTLAYAELCYKRAIANARILRFSFRFLLIATVLYAVHMVWIWKSVSRTGEAVLAGILVEVFVLRYYGSRKKKEVEETKQLLDCVRKDPHRSTEGEEGV